MEMNAVRPLDSRACSKLANCEFLPTMQVNAADHHRLKLRRLVTACAIATGGMTVNNTLLAASLPIDTGIDVSEAAGYTADKAVDDQLVAYYNDIQATAFLAVRSERIYFAPPFPGSAEPFTLRVSDSNGVLLHDAEYTMVDGQAVRADAAAIQSPVDSADDIADSDDPALDQPEPDDSDLADAADEFDEADNELSDELVNDSDDFDEYADIDTTDEGSAVEFTRGGQLDIAAVGNAQDGSDFERRESEQDRESDLLANFSVGVGYRSLNASLDVEGVHRSNDDNTVRYEGPRADISQFISSLRYSAGDGSVFFLNAGDISVQSGNSLVNTGMASRGFSVGFVSPDERIRWEVGRVYGQDIVGMVRGPVGFSSESYRIGASAGVKLVDRREVEWTARVSLLDVKRDVEEGFGFSESQSGERNIVRGYGTDVSFFEQRVDVSLSWAKSEYDNPAELNTDNIPEDEDFVLFDPGVTRGDAYRHTLRWDAWRNEDTGSLVSLQYATERSEPFYRSVHGDATADRRQWSLTADLEAGPVRAQIGTTQYQNNLDNLISVHTLDEAVHTADVTFDVVSWRESRADDNYSEDNRAARLIPSSVGVRASVESLQTLNGDVIILAPVIAGFDFMNQTTENVGLSLTWDGDSSSTTLDIDYTYFDNAQRERANADTKDLIYSLEHSLYRDNWTLSGRVGISANDDFDDASRSRTDLTEWGFSGSYTSDYGVTLSFGFDRSNDRFHDRVFDEQEDTKSIAYSISLDFGTWLAERLSLGVDPSVTASWQRTETDSRSVFFDSNNMSESFSFNLGVPF
jgi:hypothetical protein